MIRHAAWILTRYNVRRDTRMTPFEKICGQKYRKEILPLVGQVLARRPGANVNQLMQPWVTGLWLGRDTLSDEHLIGTAAGVMKSRVRRLQEPARWVRAALSAMLFTPWSPHLNLPGDLVYRDQRTRNQLKPERCLDSLRFLQHQPRIRSQKQRRRRRMIPEELTFQEPLPTSSSAGTATDSSMVVPGPQIPKPARPLSPAAREDSIHKTSQTNRGEYTVLALAGGDSRIAMSTLTKDQKALHSAKVNELRNMDNCGVVESGRQITVAASSLNALGIKTETGWILQSETRGTRILHKQ